MGKFIKKARKGFTLIELLIVIIILGILAATMMQSSGTSVAAAKANTIITNMQTLKNAVQTFYTVSADSQPTVDDFIANAKTYLGESAVIDKSLSHANMVLKIGDAEYGVFTYDNKSWKVECWFTNDPDRDEIQKKLSERKDSAQLRNAENIKEPYPSKAQNGQNKVAIQIPLMK